MDVRRRRSFGTHSVEQRDDGRKNKMHVKEIWRFPAKSMAGEMLRSARLDENGIEGDRKVLVRAANGHVITSRTHHKLLGLKGTIGADGEPLISGHIWNTPEALKLVNAALVPALKLFTTKAPSASMSFHFWWQPTARSPRLGTMGAGSDRTSSSAVWKD